MSSFYRPTPLEEAYSNFILSQVFGLFPPYANGIKIPGRDAVPFLTTAGVDRKILRSIWTVSDPQSVGSLTCLSQFHLLLRSVAMAQAGMFSPDSTVESMTFVVQQCASQQLPLPSFSAVEMPSVDYLMSTYGNNSNVNNNLAPSVGTMSIDDAFGALVGTQDAPLPAMGTMQSSSSQPTGDVPLGGGDVSGGPMLGTFSTENQVGTTFHTQQPPSLNEFGNPPTGGLTVSDAFAGFAGTPTNASLPSNDTTAPAATTNIIGNEQGMLQPTQMGTPGQVNSVSDAFGGLSGAQDAPLPSLDQPQAQQGDVYNDGFGGFNSVQEDDTFQTADQQPQAGLGMDQFGEFESVQNQPSTAQTTFSNVIPTPGLADMGTGGIVAGDRASQIEATMAGGDVPSQMTVGEPTTLPVSDAFGAVSHNEPVSSLTTQEPIPTTLEGSAVVSVQEDATAIAFENKVELPRDGCQGVSGNMNSLGSPGPTISVSDAFEGLTANDAPVPGLGQATDLVQESETADALGENDDEFGAFKSVPNEHTPHDTTAGAIPSEAFGPSLTQTSPKDVIADPDDPFAGMSATSDAPLPKLEQLGEPITTSDQDEFNDFQEGIVSAPATGGSGESSTDAKHSLDRHVSGTESFYTAQSSMSSDREVSDYRDAQQQPTDPLESMSVGQVPMPDPSPFSQPEANNNVRDTRSTPSNNNVNAADAAAVPNIDDPFSAFDAIPTAQYEQPPQPSLGFHPATEATTSDLLANKRDEDQFGAFDEAPAPSAGQEDLIGDGKDLSAATIPSQPTQDVQGDGEKFGDIGGASPSEPTEEAKAEDDDAFGDFDEAPASAQATGSSEGQTDGMDTINKGISVPDADGNLLLTPADTIAPQQGDIQGGGIMPAPISDDPFSAFDAISTPQVELPSKVFQSTQENSTLPAGETTEDDDEFGDFGGAAKPVSPEPLASDGNALIGFNDASQPGATNEGEKAYTADDRFGAFDGPDTSNSLGEPGTQAGGVDVTAPLQASLNQTSSVDEFGSFECVSHVVESDTKAEVDGTFVYFGGASQSVPTDNSFAASGGTDNATAAPTNQTTTFNDSGDARTSDQRGTPGENDDAFGDFSDVSKPNTTDTEGEDTFGDFDGAFQANPEKDPENNEQFGSFDNTGSSAPPANQAVNDDDFGDFGGPTTSEAKVVVEDDFGDFSDFAGAPQSETKVSLSEGFDAFNTQIRENIPADNNSKVGQIPAAESELTDFGSFEEAPTTSNKTSEKESISKSDVFNENLPTVESGFSDFGSFEQAPTTNVIAEEEAKPKDGESELSKAGVVLVEQEPASEDGWGDFEVVSAPKVDDEVDFDASFGDFATATTTSPSDPQQKVSSNDTISPQSFHDRIRSMSQQLPEPLRRQVGQSGDHIDLGECFEVNIGMDTPLTPEKQRRAERCIRLLELLSNSHAKLGSTYWEQCLTVVRDELTMATSLFEKAKNLSAAEKDQVRHPLKIFVKGLAEYVRVARSIVAAIGDLLMLDVTAFLSIDTWNSSWCSMSILHNALEIEKLWKEVSRQCKEYGLSDCYEVDTKNSLTKIRTTCSERISTSTTTSNDSFQLCQLTLQPLSSDDNETTRSEVAWGGRKFMACSANFLAHKCPFYYVNE